MLRITVMVAFVLLSVILVAGSAVEGFDEHDPRVQSIERIVSQLKVASGAAQTASNQAEVLRQQAKVTHQAVPPADFKPPLVPVQQNVDSNQVEGEEEEQAAGQTAWSPPVTTGFGCYCWNSH